MRRNTLSVATTAVAVFVAAATAKTIPTAAVVCGLDGVLTVHSNTTTSFTAAAIIIIVVTPLCLETVRT